MEYSVLSNALNAINDMERKGISLNILKVCMRGLLIMNVMFVTNDFIRNVIGKSTVLFIRTRSRINVINVARDLITRVFDIVTFALSIPMIDHSDASSAMHLSRRIVI